MARRDLESGRGISRRGLFRGGAVGGGALAAAALLPAAASASPSASSAEGRADMPGAPVADWSGRGSDRGLQVPGIKAQLDVRDASPVIARTFVGLFRAKTNAEVDATMAFFSRKELTYIDATVGLANYTWQSQYDIFAQFMPHWPTGSASYPAQIMGDERSAVVVYTDTAGLFGPQEIRAFGVVNFEAGKVARWIDYWDGRHFGVANRNALKVPDGQFPTDFKENTVGETAPQRLQAVAAGLAAALRAQDYAQATSYFAPDAVLTDHPSHVALTGLDSIGDFLTNAGATLPYVGPRSSVRHTVGGEYGGAYEWTNTGPVPRGANLIELDPWGHIARLDSIWDGALVTDDTLLTLARAALEH